MTLSTDPDFHHKLAEYRRKAADGTISLDEMRQAVQLMRQGRVAAAASSAKARTTTKKTTAPVDADSLLSELDLI